MSKRVVVIGGGIVGLCVAYYCAGKGHRVTLIERGDPDREGCSFANAGMVVGSHIVPLASPGMTRLALRAMWDAQSPVLVRPRLSFDLLAWAWKFQCASTPAHVDRAAPLLRDLHRASRDCYTEWSARWGEELGLREQGLLMLCRTRHAFDEEAGVARYSRNLGIACEVLSAAEVSRLEPAIRLSIAGAVYFPGDCHLVPGRVMALLAREIETAGVDVRYGTCVYGWRHAADRIEAIRVDGDEVAGEEFVVCAGVWSAALVENLGIALPLQAGKGYSLTIDSPEPAPRIGAILTEARIAMTPMGSVLRFGGTMEFAGIDETIDPARVRGIVHSIAGYLPEFTPERFQHAKLMAGLRPCSPDGLPYIGRVSSYRNLSVATGHAMIGVSLAPITGKLIAELISEESTSVNIDALRPDRYS